MRTILITLLGLVILQGLALAGIDSDISKENRVILSTGRWKPSAEETQKALAAIQSFLEKPSSTNDWTAGEIKKILGHTKQYRVQFVGVIRYGKRLIWCNFFPAPRNAEKDEFDYWKRQKVEVFDGGYHVYFTVYVITCSPSLSTLTGKWMALESYLVHFWFDSVISQLFQR